jgi:hypothetical protein
MNLTNENNNNPDADLKELITCKLCFNILNEPYDTKCCSETFCLKCITEFIAESLKCTCGSKYNKDAISSNIHSSSKHMYRYIQSYKKTIGSPCTRRLNQAKPRRSTLISNTDCIEEAVNQHRRSEKMNKVIDMLQSLRSSLVTPSQTLADNINEITRNLENEEMIKIKINSEGLLNSILAELSLINEKLYDIENNMESNYNIQKIMNKEINKYLFKLIDSTKKYSEEDIEIKVGIIEEKINMDIEKVANGSNDNNQINEASSNLDVIMPRLSSWIDIYI